VTSRHLSLRKAVDVAIEASVYYGGSVLTRMPGAYCLAEFEGGSPTHDHGLSALLEDA
jgi:hypothetical protein